MQRNLHKRLWRFEPLDLHIHASILRADGVRKAPVNVRLHSWGTAKRSAAKTNLNYD